MIKNGFKRFLGIGLFVLFGGLFSSCFGSNITIQVDSCQSASNIENCLVDVIGNFDNNTYENILFYQPYGSFIKGWFWYQGKLANYVGGTQYNDLWNGPRNKAVINKTYCSTGYLGTCNDFSISTDSFYSLANITLDSITWIDYDGSQNAGQLCFNFLSPADTTYCFAGIDATQGGDGGGCNGFEALSGIYECIPEISANRTEPVMSANIIVENAGFSPFVGGGGDNGGGNLVPVFSDVDNAISYFENTKGYNESMCYVGTYNLTGVYGTSGVSFQEGTGDTIFQLYNSLYSGFGSNLVTNVGNFIDVWTLNYFQWFYNSNEEYGVRRLATYNGPDTLYDIYYENLTFPFTDNPVAIFFMASNLYDGYDYVYNYGSYISSYCYMKLNYDNIKSGDIDYVNDVVSLLPSAIDNNIKDYVKYDFNYGNTGYYYSPEWINNFSGDYTLSENYDLDNVFTNFVDVFNSKLGNITFGFTFGIIPDWILYPLIFLILFRIMKH